MNNEDFDYIITEAVRVLEREQGYEGVDLRELTFFVRQRYKVTPEEVHATIARLQRQKMQETQIVGTSCFVFNIK